MASMQQIKEAKTMNELTDHLQDTVDKFTQYAVEANAQNVDLAEWTTYVLCHSVLHALKTIEGGDHEGSE